MTGISDGGGTPLVPAATLVITADDLPMDVLAQVEALRTGTRIMGGSSPSAAPSSLEEETERVINAAMPAVIAKRVKAIRPPGFVVAQLELKIVLKGEILGCGVSGEVLVKLAPEKLATDANRS